VTVPQTLSIHEVTRTISSLVYGEGISQNGAEPPNTPEKDDQTRTMLDSPRHNSDFLSTY
jgi:hypothetical protein